MALQRPHSPTTPSDAIRLSKTRRAFPFALYFFWNFGFINILFTFLPLYFHQLGLSLFQIGLLVACLSLSSVTAPLWTLRLTSHGISPQKLLLTFTTLSLVSFSPFLIFTSFWPIFGSVAVTLFLLTAALTLVDGAALRADIAGELHYGHTRIWGSIGFVVVTTLLGSLVFKYSLAVVPFVAASCLLGVVLGAFVVRHYLKPTSDRSRRTKHEVDSRADNQLAPTPKNRTLLGAGIFLHWASIAIMASYLSLQFKSLDWSSATISAAWNVAIMAEILALFTFHRIEQFFKLKTILSLSLFAATLRWSIVAASTDLPLLFFAQFLQAGTFALFHIAAIKLLFCALPPQQRGHTQPFYQLVGPGLGAIAGSVLGGLVAQYYLTAATLSTLFWAAAGADLVALACALLLTSANLKTHAPRTGP